MTKRPVLIPLPIILSLIAGVGIVHLAILKSDIASLNLQSAEYKPLSTRTIELPPPPTPAPAPVIKPVAKVAPPAPVPKPIASPAPQPVPVPQNAPSPVASVQPPARMKNQPNADNAPTVALAKAEQVIESPSQSTSPPPEREASASTIPMKPAPEASTDPTATPQPPKPEDQVMPTTAPDGVSGQIASAASQTVLAKANTGISEKSTELPVTPIDSAVVPEPFLLIYDLAGKYNSYDSFSAYHPEMLFKREGDQYELSFKIAMGLLNLTSTGKITPQGLAPVRHGQKTPFRSELAAHFNYDNHTVSFSNNKTEVPLSVGAQDRGSVGIQLAAVVGANPGKFVPGTNFTIQTLNPNGTEMWQFSIMGKEKITLPAGTMDTIKLARLPRQGREKDMQVEIWLATEHHYLPVRLKVSWQDGNWGDAQLSKIGKP